MVTERAEPCTPFRFSIRQPLRPRRRVPWCTHRGASWPPPTSRSTMTDLPTRLSQGNTKVTYRARRGDARAELKEAVDRKYVHVLFTETQGGTELGFPLDEA